MGSSEYCPRCDQLVARVYRPGDRPPVNEYDDPLVFVEHHRDDERAGIVTREHCPGSGRNVPTARDAY
jgi:hypothetical protein